LKNKKLNRSGFGRLGMVFSNQPQDLELQCSKTQANVEKLLLEEF
jgi:hypothetical protein